MTSHRDLKRIIRERQSKTGESYTAARRHVMRERATLLGEAHPGPFAAEPLRLDAAVLKVNQQSARVRVLREVGQITFRSDMGEIVPGHLVTLAIERRWAFKGDDYASGRIENPRIAVEKLALEPLPLRDGGVSDLRTGHEPFRKGDPYAPFWRKLTAQPRPGLVMDPIAWGQFPGAGEENPTRDAADLAQAGRAAEAYELLMEVWGTTFVASMPTRTWATSNSITRHNGRSSTTRSGCESGSLGLPPGFDGVLLWGHIYNRPFLRCLHGYARVFGGWEAAASPAGF